MLGLSVGSEGWSSNRQPMRWDLFILRHPRKLHRGRININIFFLVISSSKNITERQNNLSVAAMKGGAKKSPQTHQWFVQNTKSHLRMWKRSYKLTGCCALPLNRDCLIAAQQPRPLNLWISLTRDVVSAARCLQSWIVVFCIVNQAPPPPVLLCLRRKEFMDWRLSYVVKWPHKTHCCL